VSFPFGPLPRLADYLEFLKTQGCTWKVKVAVARDGRSYRELIVSNASGQHYLMVNPDANERLGLQVMGNMNRRLGIDTPYVPPQPPPKE